MKRAARVAWFFSKVAAITVAYVSFIGWAYVALGPVGAGFR